MDKDYFKGTAKYYARYRPGYPLEFFEHIVDKFKLDGNGRLLDLGCGTGQLAIPLSRYFEDVVAMDPDEDMLNEGKKAAKKFGAKNIKWIRTSSDDLIKLKDRLGKFKLVTMGRSFHWMNQEKTLKILSKMVNPGGGIVIVTDGTSGTRIANKNSKWHKAVKIVIKKYLGEERRAGSSVYVDSKDRFEDIIPKTDFQNMEIYAQDYERTWNLQSIIGNLYSTSYASKFVLGNKQKFFEDELRKSLIKIEPEGRFHENVHLEAITVFK